jgi:6-phosphogluconolactonase (cycloisomerase 2 family)
MTANPSGDFLYVVDHMQVAKPGHPQQSIASFRIDPDSGALTHVAGVFSPKVKCGSACHLEPLRLAIHPAQHFAYASNVGADSVSALRFAQQRHLIANFRSCCRRQASLRAGARPSWTLFVRG